MWKVNKKWILAVSYNLTGSSYFFSHKAMNLKTKGSWLSKNINQFKYKSWSICILAVHEQGGLETAFRVRDSCTGYWELEGCVGERLYQNCFISYVHVPSVSALGWCTKWNMEHKDPWFDPAVVTMVLFFLQVSWTMSPNQARIVHDFMGTWWRSTGLILHVGNTLGNTAVNKASMSSVRKLTWNEILS